MRICLRLLIILLILPFNAYAYSVKQAFSEFYNSDIISSNHCGRNIHEFLKYLDNNNIDYKSGYVVSIHDDFLQLNHFDARWGSKESYSNGSSYYRSNWYFHVFVVIDGVAYDFSQKDEKNQKLNDYLKTSYIPKMKTENIFFQGVIDQSKAYGTQLNRKMNIYKLSDYKKSYGPALYTGSFIELFNLSSNQSMISTLYLTGDYSVDYDKITNNTDNSVTITYPKVDKGEGFFPLVADASKACRAFGYFGALTSKTKFEVSDNKKMYKMYTSLIPNNYFDINSSDIRVSFSESKTVGGVRNQPLLHYSSSITCTDLYSVLDNLSQY